MQFKAVSLLFGIVLALFPRFTLAYTRSCKTQLIRSFTLHSRITPNRINSVCPHIMFNCCTQHDQMKIHKIWSTHGKHVVKARHKYAMDTFLRLRFIISLKKKINLGAMVQAYEVLAKPKASQRTIRHLQRIAEQAKKINDEKLEQAMGSMKMGLRKFYYQVQKFRQGVLCGLCNWHNHRYFNLENQTITYSVKFCSKMMTKYFDFWKDKYGKIIKYLLLLDEFVYIVAGARLMGSALDRRLFRRYVKLVENCEKDPTKIENCAPLCDSFNVNKFSYLYDGPKQTWKRYMARFMGVLAAMTGGREDYLELFKLKYKNMSKKRFRKFQKHYSMLSKKIPKDPTVKRSKRVKFDIKFKSTQVKTTIKRKHPVQNLEIETLDDVLSSTVLYKMTEYPVDISKHKILFDAHGGFDPFRDSKKIHMNVTAEHVIAMVNHGGNDPSKLSEKLDKNLIKLLKETHITHLISFLIDNKLTYNKFDKKNSDMAKFKKSLLKKPKKWYDPRKYIAMGSSSAVLLKQTLLTLLTVVCLTFN